MRNAGLEEAQAGIKIARRNINNLEYADDTTLMAESEVELGSLLMKVKEESENVGLKLNIQKTKIMASGPITFWEIDGETVETVADFIFLGSKITADGDCIQEIKRRLPLGRKVMTNVDSILKSRDIPLSTKVHLVKAMIFPVVMYGCGSWTIRKTEHWRIDAFELWCWRRLLRIPWIAKRSNQSILKEISPGCSLEGLMLKLKLQYFGHLMWRADSFEKTLVLGKIGGRRRRGWQRIRWLDGITNSMDMSLGKLWDWWWTGRPGMLQSMGLQRVGHDWTTELNWTISRYMTYHYLITARWRKLSIFFLNLAIFLNHFEYSSILTIFKLNKEWFPRGFCQGHHPSRTSRSTFIYSVLWFFDQSIHLLQLQAARIK